MADFIKPFLTLQSNVKIKKAENIIIDNTVFKLHYRVTSILFFIFTILVTSRQYIGEHIKCIVEGKLSAKVVSSYCFFTSTFTVVKHINPDLVKNGTLPHLGVGPLGTMDTSEPLIHHNYYQWVPFMLFGQGIMFLLTHVLWKKLEGGRLKALLVGIENASYSFTDKEIKSGKSSIPSIDKKQKGIDLIKNKLIKKNYISKNWYIGLILCETLNVLHVILQIYITNKFLGGIFWSLGEDLMNSDTDQNILDAYFPKVTKCTFQKYGPSGTIQVHDVLCVMALNVINEKIYSILWFWFLFLFILSFSNLIWRLITIYLHARSPKFNHVVFSRLTKGELNTLADVTVTDSLPYKDWIFLKYLGKNIEGLLFKEIVNEITDGIHQSVSVENPDELYKLHQ